MSCMDTSDRFYIERDSVEVTTKGTRVLIVDCRQAAWNIERMDIFTSTTDPTKATVFTKAEAQMLLDSGKWKGSNPKLLAAGE